jgi:hypothetical protein
MANPVAAVVESGQQLVSADVGAALRDFVTQNARDDRPVDSRLHGANRFAELALTLALGHALRRRTYGVADVTAGQVPQVLLASKTIAHGPPCVRCVLHLGR